MPNRSPVVWAITKKFPDGKKNLLHHCPAARGTFWHNFDSIFILKLVKKSCLMWENDTRPDEIHVAISAIQISLVFNLLQKFQSFSALRCRIKSIQKVSKRNGTLWSPLIRKTPLDFSSSSLLHPASSSIQFSFLMLCRTRRRFLPGTTTTTTSYRLAPWRLHMLMDSLLLLLPADVRLFFLLWQHDERCKCKTASSKWTAAKDVKYVQLFWWF